MKWQKIKFDAIMDIFSHLYITAFRTMRGNGKFRALSFAGPCFKRWYYSSLVSDTILSPANLVQELSRQEGIPYVIAPSAKPVRSVKSIKSFEFQWCKYDTDSHPIINDLKIVVEKFIPDMNLKINGFLSEEETFLITEELSQYDPFYTEFLIELAIELRLLKKIASIHTQKVCANTAVIQKFFKGKTEDVLQNILDGAIDLCAVHLSEVLEGASRIFDAGFIKSLLKNPCSTDEIFKKVYASLGIDILSIMKRYEESGNIQEMNEEESMIISSTFFLGIMLDRWFLTPFGAYFKIIQPLYFFQFSVRNEISMLIDDIASKSDLGMVLFAPCTYYSMTKLGEKMFLNGKKAKNVQQMPQGIDFDDLLPAVLTSYFEKEQEEKAAEEKEKEQGYPIIYELKAKLNDDKLCWRTYEVGADATLHEFHNMLAFTFGHTPGVRYSFFKDKQHSVFMQYDAPGSPGKTKKSNTVSLVDFFTAENQVAYYTAYDAEEVSLEIQFMKRSERRRGVYYPRVSRRSKKVRLEEDEM